MGLAAGLAKPEANVLNLPLGGSRIVLRRICHGFSSTFADASALRTQRPARKKKNDHHERAYRRRHSAAGRGRCLERDGDHAPYVTIVRRRVRDCVRPVTNSPRLYLLVCKPRQLASLWPIR